VTSVNSIGPEGRTGLGLGDGDGAATTSLGWAADGALEDVSLHAEQREARQTNRQYVSRLCSVTLIFLNLAVPYRSDTSYRSYSCTARLQPDYDQQSRRANDEEGIERCVYHLV
jgi:hypothetical protein